ncbi:NUDIX domain-containing protein [Microbulbifer yueqingensis]|uniref:ADP-ribose pyrophosphatase YjhB, NUDIX family n=1 Tax=Microbulbifer yueqingensis TaxID=658219 RepID=A0A1G8UPH1_9GAMM|nr:NUDIX domain-containing protein [Microbulbifer yueqingensis]SDJ55377.1 ADP-ribose pyrophosphatase YjhB, NUDIX family [Microbulbifer yueqingensis]
MIKRVLALSGLAVSAAFIALLAFPGLKYTIYRELPVDLRWKISYLTSDKFLVGMVFLIERDNALLLVRHRYQDAWGLPGGWVEHGETIEQAVRRELREEIGARVISTSVMEVRKPAYTPVVDIAVRCQIEPGEMLFNDSEVVETRFFPREGLPDDILYTHKPYIQRFIALSGLATAASAEPRPATGATPVP